MRAESHHHDISDESPLFIHPSDDNPQDFIAFREEIAYAIDGNDRGKTTIDALGLNRPDLEEMRRDRLRAAVLSKRTVNVLTQLREREGQLNADLEDILQEHKRALVNHSAPSTEYFSMLQTALQ